MDEASSFSQALAVWKDVKLSELQKTLDAQGAARRLLSWPCEYDAVGLDIIENQKENVVGRKKLAEQTRGGPW
jgi:homeobox protein cut-like